MTTTTLRPDTSVAAGGAAVTGAASVHAALSDNSDASYVTNATGGLTIVDNTTMALGANDKTKALIARVRASSPANNTGLDLVVFDTTTGFLLCSVNAPSPLPVAIATYTGPSVPVALTSAQIAALQSRFQTYAGLSIRVYEAYLDVVWVAGAVATITYPTGTPAIGSSTLNATWTSVVDADADGSSRDRYRLKVFTAAQYGAGGFDPETSPAAYDSGDVVSTAQAHVATGLVNATTFRAFVKVGDSVNGVPHWGAWSGGAGSQFTTSYTPKNITSVVATPDNATARISVAVTPAAPPATYSVEVQRSTDAGASWLPVRAATNVDVPSGVFTVLDYEAPNGVACLYRARATIIVASQPVVGPWTNAGATATWTSDLDWLKHPSHPSLNRTVVIDANTPRTRHRRQGIFQPIGRTDPVVVSDVLTLNSGIITFHTATDQEAADLLALLAYDVLFLQSHPGARFGQKYIAIGDVVEGPDSTASGEASTSWPITWTEVLIPIDVGQS